MYSKTLYDKCCLGDDSTLFNIVDEAEGAAFLVSTSMVERSVRTFGSALNQAYENSLVSYSYKTNYTGALIKSAISVGARSEVVSIEEYLYAKTFGVSDRDIIFNGPGKTRSTLVQVMDKPLTLIVDSISELEMLDALAENTECAARIGLRIKPDLPFMKVESRFGVDLSLMENRRAIETVIRRGRIQIRGIHLHFTGDRSVESFQLRLDNLLQNWKIISDIEPEFVDVGGGFASSIPDELSRKLSYTVSSLQDYGECLGDAMSKYFPNGGPLLIVEPGTGILADAGVLLTPVLDVKESENEIVVVVDGTYFVVNPTMSKIHPPVTLLKKNSDESLGNTAAGKVVNVYGNSCMEIDLLFGDFEEKPAVGDCLLISQKGAYSSSMSPAFIQGIPAIFGISDDFKYERLRTRTNHQLLELLN